MSDARTHLFERLCAAAPETREPYPAYEDDLLLSRTGRPADPVAAFHEQFAAVNGKAFDAPAPLAAFLREHGLLRGYCDPSLHPLLGDALARLGLEVHSTYDRERYDEYAFGITRATGAIAETGTLIISDEDTADRLAALTPWAHVAVLSKATIHATLPAAIPAFGTSVNLTWVTGPSRTADVEGILIEGVHGPGLQIAYLTD